MTTVKNTLQARPQEKAVTYTANGQSVSLSLSTVKRYLTGGANISDEEAVMFINLCKYQRLNPWLREAYCIKYGSKPATLVTGKEAFMKRADAQPSYDGFKAGVVVIDQEGEMKYRNGALVLKDESLVGGWAEVYRKDKANSYREEVMLDEYIGRKADGSVNEQWTKRPATMIRKVALVQALKEAFPETLGALHVAEEFGAVEEEAMQNVAPVIPEAQPEPQPQVQPQVKPVDVEVAEPVYSDSLI